MRRRAGALVRLADVTNAGMTVLLRIGGIHELGGVTSGITQGGPFSGALFASAIDPVGRRLHIALRAPRAGMSRQCADGAMILIRAARCLRLLAPVAADAGRSAGVP